MMLSRNLSLLWFLLCILLGAPIYAQSAQFAPLPIADAFAQLSFNRQSRIELSPDGKWVAYTLSDPRRQNSVRDPKYRIFGTTGAPMLFEDSDVWVSNTATGKTQNLTGG